jgi:hypothetical protein
MEKTLKTKIGGARRPMGHVKTSMVGRVVVLLMFVLSATVDVSARGVKSSAEQDSIEHLLQSGSFVIHIDRAFPKGGYDTSRFLPSGTMEVIGDSLAKGDLPFFGEAYRPSYDNRGGVIFNAPMRDRTIVRERKSRMLYTFRVKADDGDELRFFIRVTPGGYCSVDLNSNYKSHISYSGTIEKRVAEEK